jgi:hypothetical protein
MSWLGRLFGGGQAETPPPLPANAVVLPDDLAAALTAGGQPLTDAAVAALREGLAQDARRAAGGAHAGERIPFWLRREDDDDTDGEIEERLRERVEQRRAAEEGTKAAGD